MSDYYYIILIDYSIILIAYLKRYSRLDDFQCILAVRNELFLIRFQKLYFLKREKLSEMNSFLKVSTGLFLMLNTKLIYCSDKRSP